MAIYRPAGRPWKARLGSQAIKPDLSGFLMVALARWLGMPGRASRVRFAACGALDPRPGIPLGLLVKGDQRKDQRKGAPRRPDAAQIPRHDTGRAAGAGGTPPAGRIRSRRSSKNRQTGPRAKVFLARAG